MICFLTTKIPGEAQNNEGCFGEVPTGEKKGGKLI
jgi:hypothetical protein